MRQQGTILTSELSQCLHWVTFTIDQDFHDETVETHSMTYHSSTLHSVLILHGLSMSLHWALSVAHGTAISTIARTSVKVYVDPKRTEAHAYWWKPIIVQIVSLPNTLFRKTYEIGQIVCRPPFVSIQPHDKLLDPEVQMQVKKSHSPLREPAPDRITNIHR